MAKKVFKLQLNSSFLFNISYMYFIMSALLVITLELVIFYNFPKYIPAIALIGLIAVKFLLKPAKDELDIGGHETITIDEDERLLTIDDSQPIRFDEISYVYLRLFKPNYISSTMLDSFIALISVNSELLIGNKNGGYISINIQRKSALLGIIKELQKYKEISLKFDENYDGSLTRKFPLFLLLLFIALLIFALQR